MSLILAFRAFIPSGMILVSYTIYSVLEFYWKLYVVLIIPLIAVSIDSFDDLEIYGKNISAAYLILLSIYV